MKNNRGEIMSFDDTKESIGIMIYRLSEVQKNLKKLQQLIDKKKFVERIKVGDGVGFIKLTTPKIKIWGDLNNISDVIEELQTKYVEVN